MASPFDSQYNTIRSRVEYYANRYGVPVNVAIQQIWQESKFNPRAGSSAGAQGIAQFIPDTARRYGVSVWDIESSLDGWGRYMRDLMRMFNGRIDIALAGYNSGENRSEYRNAARENRPINWSIMPSGVRSETKPYVNNIIARAGNGVTPTVNSSPVNNNYVHNAGDIATVDVYADDTESDDTVYWIGGLLLLGLLL